MGKAAYEDRTDLEKIQSQWHKLTGPHDRLEWSSAIVRTATAAELAANYAIREEFRTRSEFNAAFVDSLLMWANGLAGKMDKLLIPLSAGKKRSKKIKALKAASSEINRRRNAIAHQGNFANEDDAKVAIQQTRTFIESLVRLYTADFALKDQK
jgi:hypothetical protein